MFVRKNEKKESQKNEEEENSTFDGEIEKKRVRVWKKKIVYH